MISKYVKNDYNKDLTPLNDIVILRKLEKYHQKSYGDIVIAEISQMPGHNLTRAEVISIGPDAEFEGLKVGDKVMYDHFAAFGLTHPIAVLKIENIICIYEE